MMPKGLFARSLLLRLLAGILSLALLLPLWRWRWRLIFFFSRLVRPPGQPPKPHQYDYSQQEGWFLHPGRETIAYPAPAAEDPAVDVPPCAVFYIHPTTYFLPFSWHQAAGNRRAANLVRRMFLNNQARIFGPPFRLYAPRYPQATFLSFSAPPPYAELALVAATAELKRAFDQFSAEIGPMPFILAGHSQGAYHAVALLAQRIAGTPLQEQLVAVYAPGYFFPETTFQELAVPLASDQDSPGCMQTWNAVTTWHWLPPGIDNMPQPYGPRPQQLGEVRFACTNPLDPARQKVPAADNLGAYAGGFSAVPGGPQPGLVGAECVDGKLIIDRPPDSRLRWAMMGPGWYHPYDFGLFFTNIRADARRRAVAWYAGKRNEATV